MQSANMNEFPDCESLVFDHGSFSIKAGFAGEDIPRAVFPAVMGRPKKKSLLGMGDKEVYIGDEALSKRGILNMTKPIQHGIISNWDDIEKLWHHTFYNELRASPEQQPLLLTEPPLYDAQPPQYNFNAPTLSTTQYRKKSIELMFETFSVPMIHIANQQALSLMSLGKTTGVIVDVGDQVTSVVPIYEGCVIQHCVTRSELAGSDISALLKKKLSERDIILSDDVIQDIKEKHCYVDPRDYRNQNRDVLYELPDGQVITLDKELLECGEILFNPSIIGSEFPGIHDIICNTTRKVEVGFRGTMWYWKAIHYVGGTCRMKNFKERLDYEMVQTSPYDWFVSAPEVDSDVRKYSSWLGGSLLASFSSFPDMCISKVCRLYCYFNICRMSIASVGEILKDFQGTSCDKQ
jgi:actin